MSQNDSQINVENDEQIVRRIARYIAKNGYEEWMKKNPRINFVRNPEDPLHGYYKQKLTDYISQIKKNGVIVDDFGDVAKTTRTSSQVTEPPPAPGNIRDNIHWMTSLISEAGWMNGNVVRRILDHFPALYQPRLTEISSRNQQARASRDAAAAATENCSQNQQDVANQVEGAAQRIVLPYFLEFSLPNGMNIEEFGTMKLTAQFGAWYGNDFWLGFKNRPGFEFTNPTDSKFPRFTRFVLEYSDVFKSPKDLKEKVSRSDAYMAAIHDGFFRLLDQWDSLQEMKWRDGGVMSMINWHASLQKDFVDNYEGPKRKRSDEPGLVPEQEPKRNKFDEPGLVPEDQFLAQHPGWCTIRVSIICVYGYEIDIIEKTVQSLSENVASLKEKIAEEIGIPPEKQVLFGKAGLLKDNNRSLAHYNVGAGEILTLSLCIGCGRERDLDKPCCCIERHDQAIYNMKLSSPFSLSKL